MKSLNKSILYYGFIAAVIRIILMMTMFTCCHNLETMSYGKMLAMMIYIVIYYFLKDALLSFIVTMIFESERIVQCVILMMLLAFVKEISTVCGK